MSSSGQRIPLARKLGVHEGDRLALLGAPDGFSVVLNELPDGTTVSHRLGSGLYDVIVCFAGRRWQLSRRLPRLPAALAPDGGLWLAWPKRSSGLATDLSDHVVRELGLAAGLVDNKVCAIDQTWSGLRFVYRLADRPPART